MQLNEENIDHGGDRESRAQRGDRQTDSSCCWLPEKHSSVSPPCCPFPARLRLNNLFAGHYGADYVCQDMSGPGNTLI